MNFYTQFEEIKEEMRDLYLNNLCPFVLATSFGKDSSLQLLLLWEMLLTIPKEKRHKKVYVISSDTMVELEAMSVYIRSSLKMVEQQAKVLDLPIEVKLVKPEMKERYFWNVLAKGNPPVVSKSKRFRWCTSKLKQSPIDRSIREIQSNSPVGMNQDFDLYLFLGTRDSESIQRKNSMEKFAFDHSKFGRHSKYERVCAYYPIKYIHGSALWGYLFDYETLPWGMPLATLESFYPEGAFECGLKTDGQQSSCGGGRNGCWTCTFINKDKMLEEEIQKGNGAAQRLYDYKRLLMTIRNDARYRESTRRIDIKQINKRLVQAKGSSNQSNLFDSGESDEGLEIQKVDQYESFIRANDTEYSTGSLTFECRKLLLEHLLHVEEQTGLNLIEHEEVQAILEVWRTEGYNVGLVQPKEFKYDGPVVFNGQFELNEKETKNPHSLFWITREFDLGRDELVEYIVQRQQSTGQTFYYNLTNWDFGEEEHFVYNTAIFLVCRSDIHSEIEAGNLIDEWLYPAPKVESMDWEAFAQRYVLAANELIAQPNYDQDLLRRINKVLMTLGYAPVVDLQYNQSLVYNS